MSGALTAFLLARVAEDEAVVADWPEEGPWGLHPHGQMWVDSNGRPLYAPKVRALKECDAKRGVIREAEPLDSFVRDSLLRHLTLPYADHPDCREEWKL